jgi:hypothetical protein
VVDPKAADARVVMGQREAVGGIGVGEKRGIKIHPDPQRLGPIDPRPKMGRLDPVALDRPTVAVEVHRVEVQPVLAGDQTKNLLQVAA